MTSSTFTRSIAARLAYAGLTRLEVSERLGLYPSAVSDRIRGRSRWQLEELIALAGLLDLDPVDLISELIDDIQAAHADTAKATA